MTKLNSFETKLMNRVITGHTYNKCFLYLIKKVSDNKCEHCGEIENNEHLILKCKKKKLDSVRRNFPLLIQNKKLVDILVVLTVIIYKV